MILTDTDILSALAKVEQLDLLYLLLKVDQLFIVPTVLHELEVARHRKFIFTSLVFEFLEAQRITVTSLTTSELAFATTLPNTLGNGESQSIAVAHQRHTMLLSNETRVTHWCRTLGVDCLNLPSVLRSLWTEEILTQDKVRQLILDLQTYDHMGFNAKTLNGIFLSKK